MDSVEPKMPPSFLPMDSELEKMPPSLLLMLSELEKMPVLFVSTGAGGCVDRTSLREK